MSRLDELIQEYCPDGVEYVKLIDVSNILYGFPCDSSKFNENGDGLPLVRIRDVLQGKTATYTSEKVPSNYIISKGDLLVGMDGNFHVAVWKMSKSVLCQRVCRISSKDETVICGGFINHLLPPIVKTIEQNKQSGTVKHLLSKDINSIKIPLPPIKVQQEIVRILDSFTELTAELQAELQARKKQYEFYRNQILLFEDAVEKVKLGDVCNFVRGPFGGALKKEIFQSEGYAVYEQQNAIYNNLNFRYFVNAEKFMELKRFAVKSSDLIMSCSGTIGKTFVIPENAPEGIINQALLKLTPNEKVNVFYLQYFFENTISQIMNNVARGGAIKNVPSVDELKKIEFPLPSLDKQQRIVSILDRFDALCNDISSGLPAEIEARQKQYEYYRDKLLTFKRLGGDE